LYEKLCIVIVFALFLVACQRKEVGVKLDLLSNDMTSVTNNDYIASITNNDDYSIIQNDLVYRDYGTGIKLSRNSKLIISQLDLGLKDENATIYAINLENGELIELCDYQPNHDINFIPDLDGVYKIVAEVSDGQIIDLTPKAMVEGVNSEENTGGLIPLK